MPTRVKEKRKSSRRGTKKMPRAEREAQLLDLAESAFAERGFHAVSMDDIAAAAGVTKPLVYAYFGSKEGLYLAGIRRAYERCVERVEEAVEGVDDPGEMLTRVIHAVFGWVDDYREHWPYIFGAQALGGRFAEEGARDLADMVSVITRILERFVTDPATASEIEPLAEASVGVTNAIADRWIRHPEEPQELQEERVIRILAPATAALAQAR
jgi:AcrR family transcriptional regulator